MKKIKRVLIAVITNNSSVETYLTLGTKNDARKVGQAILDELRAGHAVVFAYDGSSR